VKLYCTNFDRDPFAEGWTTSTESVGASPWVWDVVPGTGATDPPTAFTGTRALIQGLGGDYPADSYSKVELPEIDVGSYSDVRLQYRRWLAVEDAHYDQAQITANGKRAWMNSTENHGDSSAQHHIDKEWRFQDVALSGYFSGHKLKVGFDLRSDPGLDLGGWAIDDLCVVANRNSICGDGIRSPTEECDDGPANADLPDQCRTYCRRATCGDTILDAGEECDEGSATATCSDKCTLIPNDDAGCCSANRGAPTALLGLALGLVGLRRRRR
jgi:cysteine-rich repeat protein